MSDTPRIRVPLRSVAATDVPSARRAPVGEPRGRERPAVLSLASGVEQPERVGALGSRLIRLHGLGLPVLPGFVVTTDAWRAWRRAGGVLPESVRREVARHVDRLVDELVEVLGVDAAAPVQLRARATKAVGLAQRNHREVHQGPRRAAAGAADALPEIVLAVVESLWHDHDGEDLDDDGGLAVVVQPPAPREPAGHCGHGVAITRDPGTGSPGTAGWFRCDDAPAGRTDSLSALRQRFPAAFGALDAAAPLVEAVWSDMCEVPFAVGRDQLWILDTRPAERSGAAAIRVAVELVDEGLIDVREALSHIPLSAVVEAQWPVFSQDQELDVIARGLPLVAGAGVGAAVFDADAAAARAAAGEPTVLLVPDVELVDVARLDGVRAVVVAAGKARAGAGPLLRGAGRPAVGDVAGLQIDVAARLARPADGTTVREGDIVSVDGSRGIITRGEVRLVPPQPDLNAARFLTWCEEHARLPVLEAAPDGWARIADVADAAAPGTGRAVVAVSERAGQRDLERAVAAALEAGATELALELPGELAGLDLSPPRAPWRAIVAPREQAWAAALLAARIDVA